MPSSRIPGAATEAPWRPSTARVVAVLSWVAPPSAPQSTRSSRTRRVDGAARSCSPARQASGSPRWSSTPLTSHPDSGSSAPLVWSRRWPSGTPACTRWCSRSSTTSGSSAGSTFTALLQGAVVLVIGVAFGVPLSPLLAANAAFFAFVPQVGGLLAAIPLIAFGLTQGLGTAVAVGFAVPSLDAAQQLRPAPAHRWPRRAHLAAVQPGRRPRRLCPRRLRRRNGRPPGDRGRACARHPRPRRG